MTGNEIKHKLVESSLNVSTFNSSSFNTCDRVAVKEETNTMISTKVPHKTKALGLAKIDDPYSLYGITRGVLTINKEKAPKALIWSTGFPFWVLVLVSCDYEVVGIVFSKDPVSQHWYKHIPILFPMLQVWMDSPPLHILDSIHYWFVDGWDYKKLLPLTKRGSTIITQVGMPGSSR